MIFTELEISGVFRIEPERHEDERGFFARTFCIDEFESHELEPVVAQISTSSNHRLGTLRGLHVQLPPHEETKVVRCTQGAVYDVVVDLRGTSPSFSGWLAEELSNDNGCALYVPRGCAHGFLTLTDDTTLEYVISTPYTSGSAAGIRWDDPAIGVQWPIEPVVMSPADACSPSIDLDRIRSDGLKSLGSVRLEPDER